MNSSNPFFALPQITLPVQNLRQWRKIFLSDMDRVKWLFFWQRPPTVFLTPSPTVSPGEVRKTMLQMEKDFKRETCSTHVNQNVRSQRSYTCERILNYPGWTSMDAFWNTCHISLSLKQSHWNTGEPPGPELLCIDEVGESKSTFEMSLQEGVERLVCCRHEQLSRTNSAQCVAVLYNMNSVGRAAQPGGRGVGAPAYPSTGSHTSQQSVLLKNGLLVEPLSSPSDWWVKKQLGARGPPDNSERAFL